MTQLSGLAWLGNAYIAASQWGGTRWAMTQLSGLAWLGYAYIVASQWAEPSGNDQIAWFGLAR